MDPDRTVSRVTAFLHRNISKDVLDALKEAGVKDLQLCSARSLVIEVKRGLLSLLPGRDLAQDPLDVIFFLVRPEMEDPVVSLIIEKGHLYSPGRGSVVVEEVVLVDGHEACKENEIPTFNINPPSVHLQSCTGICCITRRGQGDSVARIALDTGTCVPAVHFGTGTGVRDKMGLLRITIPAEKEIIQVLASPYEADNIMEMMIDAGRLDHPGSGFIYAFPIKKALVNMRVTRGERRYAASIEQIVTALDHIKGNTEWRHRRNIAVKRFARQKRYIRNLVDLMLLCDAGTGTELVTAAMSAGAGGATISSLRHICPSDSPRSEISPSRDACSMVIPEEKEETVTTALRDAGAFTDRCHGQIQLRKTYQAFTYTGTPRPR